MNELLSSNDSPMAPGDSNVGTVPSRLISKQLSLEANEIGIAVKSCYINGETVSSDTEVVKTLNRLILDDESSIKGGVSLTSHFNVFCRLINLFKGILISILDEVDKLKNPDLINVFSRRVSLYKVLLFTHIALLVKAGGLNLGDFQVKQVGNVFDNNMRNILFPLFFPIMVVSGERAVNFIKHAVLTDSFHTI